MTIAQIIVTIGGLALSALVIWYFLFSQAAGTRAAVGAGGVQEAQIIVKGGYTPDVLVVKAGWPMRRRVFGVYARRQVSSVAGMDKMW